MLLLYRICVYIGKVIGKWLLIYYCTVYTCQVCAYICNVKFIFLKNYFIELTFIEKNVFKLKEIWNNSIDPPKDQYNLQYNLWHPENELLTLVVDVYSIESNVCDHSPITQRSDDQL